MKVPFLDLRHGYAELRAELDAAYQRVAASGWYVLGPELERFEAEFAEYSGVGHCVGVGSGLDALTLTLRSLDVGPGDEVIVPSNTFIATWMAVVAVGARPVPVEPDERTSTIDPAGVEAAIGPRTAAIVPVHLYGQPADMDAIGKLAARYQLPVVEDAAQAHGARYEGRRAGGLSTAAAFSLNPVKNLGAWGNAGVVTTDDAAIAAKVRLLRNYGSRVKYHHEVLGTNSRLDELQAGQLRVRLRHLDEWNARRRASAATYTAGLAEAAGLVLPHVPEWAEPVWHLYVVRHPLRDALQRHLAEAGIGTLIHYPVPPHRSPAFRDRGWRPGAFPVAERLAGEVLSLPLNPHLSDREAHAVVRAVEAAADACRVPPG
ncbi:DegT/DnrJ/EryC1/StrS family aminotransferase [Actinosynnema sp. CS-041913]|uniref:DegT/DnrJ/EryC1/StrS family aminotransferase n=1 Tax=Actinosynnema sp. CS-041913 TaxID=3239917 RepID=UPI003D950661